ncbi:MAG: glycerol-3-phosphate dehydrogenase [Planctomycetota bacterium]|nr:MAG: glycerol-3-phosphate dehydrogenase [Planctomycetota bacterium]
MAERAALPAEVDAVVAGAGIAGAASAWWLARAGLRVLLLEREPTAAAHASGRNAAIARLLAEDEIHRRLARASIALYREPPPELPLRGAIARASGSLTLASGEALARLRATVAAAAAEGLPLRWLEPARAAARLPLLDPNTFEAAVWCPEEAVLDVHAIVEGLLAGARALGARVCTGTAIEGVELRYGEVYRVVTPRGAVRTRWLVNAAGAWAGELARLAGAAPMPLRVTKRHLLVTEPLPELDPDWPIAWDIAREYYLRPESGGLLLSGCDVIDDVPGDAQPDEQAVHAIAARLAASVPRLAAVGLRRVWAGHRTLTPDDRFVIGPDTEVLGFLWVAGLGGHGMSAGAEVGRLAASWITGSAAGDPLAHAMAPGRFGPRAASEGANA